MKFTVEGADEKTGQEQKIVVSARDAKDAERQARYAGILVSKVRERDQEESLPYASPSAAAKEMSLKATAVNLNAPDSTALKTMSHVFFAFACIGYFAAAILLVLTVILIITEARWWWP